jgi:hypothetical protein
LWIKDSFQAIRHEGALRGVLGSDIAPEDRELGSSRKFEDDVVSPSQA